MSSIQFGCPHCGGQFEIDASAAGQETACPACGGALLVPSLSDYGPPPPGFGPPPPPEYGPPAGFAPPAYVEPAGYGEPSSYAAPLGHGASPGYGAPPFDPFAPPPPATSAFSPPEYGPPPPDFGAIPPQGFAPYAPAPPPYVDYSAAPPPPPAPGYAPPPGQFVEPYAPPLAHGFGQLLEPGPADLATLQPPPQQAFVAPVAPQYFEPLAESSLIASVAPETAPDVDDSLPPPTRVGKKRRKPQRDAASRPANNDDPFAPPVTQSRPEGYPGAAALETPGVTSFAAGATPVYSPQAENLTGGHNRPLAAPADPLAVHEPTTKKIVTASGQVKELRVLSPEEKAARRFRRNLLVLTFGLVILAIVVAVLNHFGHIK